MLPRLQHEVHHRPAGLLARKRSTSDGLKRNRRVAWVQRGSHEVVVLDARELEITLASGPFGNRSRRDALFVVRNGNDAFGLQRVAAGCRRLPAKASTPLDRRRKEAIGLVHLTAQAHDVRRGLELKLFDDAKALAVAVFECPGSRSRQSLPELRAPCTARRSAF